MSRLLLFLSALAPGFIVSGIRLLSVELLTGIFTIILGCYLLVSGILVIKFRRQDVEPRPVEITQVSDESYQVPTYLLTFIFPFMFIELHDFWNAFAYFVIVVFVAFLLSKTDLSLVNPALLLAGYHMYSVQLSGGDDITLISKSRPRVGSQLVCFPLAGRLYIDSLRNED